MEHVIIMVYCYINTSIVGYKNKTLITMEYKVDVEIWYIRPRIVRYTKKYEDTHNCFGGYTFIFNVSDYIDGYFVKPPCHKIKIFQFILFYETLGSP